MKTFKIKLKEQYADLCHAITKRGLTSSCHAYNDTTFITNAGFRYVIDLDNQTLTVSNH